MRLGLCNLFTVAEIRTDADVTGYAFGNPAHPLPPPSLTNQLVGGDVFAIDRHIAASGNRLGVIEHALWDAAGRALGQPVHRLMGGAGATSIPAYLTCVWPGDADQSGVSPDEQAAFAAAVKAAGFSAMKIRAWRPDPFDDVRACGLIREAAGPDFTIMVDRTADLSGALWDWATALRVAVALNEHAVAWLEEPLARDDLDGSARLAAAVEMPITGGEGYQGLASFDRALKAGAFDIVQPDALASGGLSIVRKVAALAEAAGVPCVPHGYGSLPLAGYLQVAAAIGSPWQEVVYVVPPALPEDLWWPARTLLGGEAPFVFADGCIKVPTGPGLGLPVDPDALARCRVERFSRDPAHVPLGAGQVAAVQD